jgi:preprotein translocase subunit SecG
MIGDAVIASILLTILHVAVCLFLIVVVLLQSGKAADLAGAFGGTGSQTAFGPRGSATLLSKATTVSAILFMLTSMSLSIVATRNTGGGNSILNRKPLKQTSAPVVPGAKPKVSVSPVPAPTTQAPVPAAPTAKTPTPAAPKK